MPIETFYSRRLKDKVTLEGQMIKWSLIELVRAITCTFMHCYVPNFEENEGAYGFGLIRLSVHLPLPPAKTFFFLRF